MESFRLVKTTPEHPGYKKLVPLLDADLRIRDGEDHAFYAQYNKSDSIRHVIVAIRNDIAVGIGAFKQYEEGVAEIKRMYVLPEQRGQGIARQVLHALEEWAKENNYRRCILETGVHQPEAIQLYKSSNYAVIPNYGQYAGVADSVCMEKLLA